LFLVQEYGKGGDVCGEKETAEILKVNFNSLEIVNECIRQKHSLPTENRIQTRRNNFHPPHNHAFESTTIAEVN
jgi:hypothetical protein